MSRRALAGAILATLAVATAGCGSHSVAPHGHAAPPAAAITQVAPRGSTRSAGHLPVAMSGTTAMTMGTEAYSIGHTGVLR